MIQILQLGTEDWNECFKVPDYVTITHNELFETNDKASYDLVFVDGEISGVEAEKLHKITAAYTFFVTDRAVMNEPLKYLCRCKNGKRIPLNKIQAFLDYEAKNFYGKPYGEKCSLNDLAIAQGFEGSVEWNGNYSVNIEGEYGEELNQIAYWRGNLPIMEGQALEFWLEYKKDPTVEIAISITQFKIGSVSEVQQKWYFSEKELDELAIVDNQKSGGQLFVSLLAKGSGKLQIIALHDRYSRRGHGAFLPGGKRYVTSNREEIFYYFDPGDLKPPLNVYFSGYKTLQGFEGYNMMRNLGCPFLLVGEPRLEGGCFYMGDEEYEKGISGIIVDCMHELGFSSEQVILSGISMGSFGAIYYGCDILPHAMIVGKPLLSVGDVAANERLSRPGGFPTSLDVLNYISDGIDEVAIEKLNHRFWEKFERTNWGKSKFVLSYMLEDDYDGSAYENMISRVNDAGAQLYGKGIHGRHNDATNDIASWFKSQYVKILCEDFGRS